MDLLCVWKNYVDPDQLASDEASWSGSTLFPKECKSFWKSQLLLQHQKPADLDLHCFIHLHCYNILK